MRRIPTTIVAVAFAVGAFGCGTSGGDGNSMGPGSTTGGQESVAATTTSTIAQRPDPGLRTDYERAIRDWFELEDLPDGGSCAVLGAMDALDPERLAEAGVRPEELASADLPDALGLDEAGTDALRAAVIEEFEACDLGLRFAELLEVELMDELRGELDGLEVDLEPHRACIFDGLTSAGAPMFASVVVDGVDAYRAGERMGYQAMTGCPELLLTLLDAAFEAEGMEITAADRACLLEGLQGLDPDGGRSTSRPRGSPRSASADLRSSQLASSAWATTCSPTGRWPCATSTRG